MRNSTFFKPRKFYPVLFFLLCTQYVKAQAIYMVGIYINSSNGPVCAVNGATTGQVLGTVNLYLSYQNNSGLPCSAPENNGTFSQNITLPAGFRFTGSSQVSVRGTTECNWYGQGQTCAYDPASGTYINPNVPRFSGSGSSGNLSGAVLGCQITSGSLNIANVQVVYSTAPGAYTITASNFDNAGGRVGFSPGPGPYTFTPTPQGKSTGCPITCNAGSSAPGFNNAQTSFCTNATTSVNLNSYINSATPSGTTLQWATNASALTTSTISSTVSVSGTYFGFYNDAANSCQSPALSVPITFSAPPNKGTTSNTTACSAGGTSTVNLNNLISGASAGSWSTTSGATIGSSNVVDFTAKTAGSYAFTYTATGTGACANVTNSATVSVSNCAPSTITVNAKVLLEGALSIPTSANMTTLLNTRNLIPLAQPYTYDNAPALTAASIPAGVTDWVLVELRNVSNPKQVIESHAGFLKADGTLLDATGATGVRFNSAPGNYLVAIRHRNHLAVRTTSIALAAGVNSTIDFTTGAGGNLYTNPVFSANNPPMATINGVMAMWAGDVNQDGLINAFGLTSDVSAITNVLGINLNVAIGPVYNSADINLNSVVSYYGITSDVAILTRILINQNAVIKQHL